MSCKKILAITSDFEACGQWRIIQPLKRLASDAVQFQLYQPNTNFHVSAFDGLLIQRPYDPPRGQLVDRFKQLGKKVIVDLDDRFPLLDPTHESYADNGPDSQTWAIMRQCIVKADGLIVSTPELEEFYRPMNRNIVVAMNAIDLQAPIYQKPLPHPPELTGKTVMFWSGQLWGHSKNLSIIKSAVEQAITQVPQLCLLMCTPRPLANVFTLPPNRLFHIDPLPFEQFVQVASLADFSLAPLELNDFNDCKSEIRILESAAWGVPCIASPAAPYRRFYEESNRACLLVDRNDPQIWLDNIIRLATRENLRRELGARAKLAIEREYDLNAENKKREGIFASE